MIGVALVGFGYWGPNLARNFSAQKGAQLLAICELRQNRAEEAARCFPQARITGDYTSILNDPAIQVVLLATPVSSHFELAKEALLAGKDILVEKPFTQTVPQAEELVALGESLGRIVGVDHTFLYTGAVRKIKELVSSGQLGDLLYFDSVRINLGLFQEDVNVIHDLAPHDLAILNHIVGQRPVSVVALGACHTRSKMENLAYLHLEYQNDFVAHFHFNWLAPVKIRKTLIAGTSKMIVYDDMEASEKVKVYDKGVVVSPDKESFAKIRIDHRTGDMWAPKLIHREALNMEAEEFLRCVRERSKPLVDARDGLEVVRLLDAAHTSLRAGGQRVALQAP